MVVLLEGRPLDIKQHSTDFALAPLRSGTRQAAPSGGSPLKLGAKKGVLFMATAGGIDLR